MTNVRPSVRETAFNCPHCGALATQYWYSLQINTLGNNRRVPLVLTPDMVEAADFTKFEDVDERKRQEEWARMMAKRHPFLWGSVSGGYRRAGLQNVFVAECFNCKRLSLWIHDRLVYPDAGGAPPPNPDLSEDIRRDYDEASNILDRSPRGAAALIRLAIQKLCKELGRREKDLNSAIGALVMDGLDPRVQQALDIVRVVGNSAVHPGQMDLRDDRATAESLFRLLNEIVEIMVSRPKHLDAIYADLPETARDAIERRDGGD